MKDILLKLKSVYLPFLTIAIGFIVGYTFLNWLLIIKLQLFTPKEIIVDLLLPIILVWGALYIWIRPRIKLLNLMIIKGYDVLYFIYLLSAIFIISLPLTISQYYLKDATGQLLHLPSIDEIGDYPVEKYYRVDTCYIDKNGTSIETSLEVIGKGVQRNLRMSIYVVMPMYEHPSDPINGVRPSAWYGMVFHNYVDNLQSESEKSIAFKKFLDDTHSKIKKQDLNQFEYLERVGETNDLDHYLRAINDNAIYRYSTITPHILIPRNESFEMRLGSIPRWTFLSLLFGLVVFFIMVIIPPIDEEQLEQLKNKGRNLLKESVSSFINPITPHSGFIATPILIIINILIYLLIALSSNNYISFDIDTLVEWGGSSLLLVSDEGEWWRLLTNMFIHNSLLHLGMNVIALYFIGMLTEPVIGIKRTLFTYIIAGLCASLASLYLNDATISVGASGAIMGLYGLMGALLLPSLLSKDLSSILIRYLAVFVIYNLLMTIIGDVDYAAHTIGFVAGFIIGLIMKFIASQSKKHKSH